MTFFTVTNYQFTTRSTNAASKERSMKPVKNNEKKRVEESKEKKKLEISKQKKKVKKYKEQEEALLETPEEDPGLLEIIPVSEVVAESRGKANFKRLAVKVIVNNRWVFLV